MAWVTQLNLERQLQGCCSSSHCSFILPCPSPLLARNTVGCSTCWHQGHLDPRVWTPSLPPCFTRNAVGQYWGPRVAAHVDTVELDWQTPGNNHPLTAEGNSPQFPYGLAKGKNQCAFCSVHNGSPWQNY